MESWILHLLVIFVILIHQKSVLSANVSDPIEPICGIRNLGAKTGLIFKGTLLKQGEFPWLAAFLERKPKQLPSYFCGGALISQDRVVTAAHCMHPKGDVPKLEKGIVIVLGGYDINEPYETGRQTAFAKEIIIQTAYNSKDYNRFTGDIALIILTENVHFTKFVNPVCLFTKGHIDDYEETATVGGWGITEEFHTEGAAFASFIDIPILSNEKCYREDPRLAGIGWDESFCAGKEGVGVCSGDSGSGIYVEINGKYYLKGVLSAAINGGACGGNHLAIFANTTNYDLSAEGGLRNLNKKVNSESSEKIPPKLIRCGRVPVEMPGKLYGNKILTTEDIPWFVEFTTDKYTVLGVLLTPDTIITSLQPKVSGSPPTISVGGIYIDNIIKKVTNITNADGHTPIGSIVKLSSPVKELQDLPCLLPDYYVPSEKEEVFSFDETFDDDERRQISLGKNIDIKKCDALDAKENEANRYCVQLSSTGVFPSFAFTVKDEKLSIIGVFRRIGSTLEKGQFYDLITFKAISSKNVQVKYP